MRLRSTHTLAMMEVSESTYNEIKDKLKEAGYKHSIEEPYLDMTHIGLVREEGKQYGDIHEIVVDALREMPSHAPEGSPNFEKAVEIVERACAMAAYITLKANRERGGRVEAESDLSKDARQLADYVKMLWEFGKPMDAAILVAARRVLERS